jgi:prophage maintenance system killer protein
MHEEDETKKSKIGGWKTEPNYIYNYKNERFDFVLPVEVPAKMHDLLNKTNAAIDAIQQNKKDAPHPVDVALQFHLDYVIIHPFYDGNGRTARIFANLLLISFGYPPFWVKTNERSIYSQYIGDIQGYGGSAELFYEFAAGLILRSQQLVLDAIEGKDISEEDDLDKELQLLRAELKGEDLLTAIASVDTICGAIKQNIIPLFKIIEEKCESLNEFFFFIGRTIEFQVQGEAGKRVVGSNVSKWEDIEINFLENQICGQGKRVSNIMYSYRLNGFKKNSAGSTFWINIETHFNEYNYLIQTNKNRTNPAQIPYGKKISKEDLLKIATPLIKEIIDDIKRLNGNK